MSHIDIIHGTIFERNHTLCRGCRMGSSIWADAFRVKRLSHGQNYAQESARSLARLKLIQTTTTDELDCRTNVGVARASTVALFLPLHQARGIYVEHISYFRMSLLVDFVVSSAAGRFNKLRIDE
jgi:hypothetical protein